MEEYSQIHEPFDKVGLLSGRPNKDVMIDSSVVNMIVPACFKGEIIQEVGDYFTYCSSSPTPKRFHDLHYRPNACQIKYRARALASMNKMPGFHRITGYKQSLMFSTGMLATDKTVSKIINRMT